MKQVIDQSIEKDKEVSLKEKMSIKKVLKVYYLSKRKAIVTNNHL